MKLDAEEQAIFNLLNSNACCSEARNLRPNSELGRLDSSFVHDAQYGRNSVAGISVHAAQYGSSNCNACFSDLLSSTSDWGDLLLRRCKSNMKKKYISVWSPNLIGGTVPDMPNAYNVSINIGHRFDH